MIITREENFRSLLGKVDKAKMRLCLRCRKHKVNNGGYLCGSCNRVNSRSGLWASYLPGDGPKRPEVSTEELF